MKYVVMVTHGLMAAGTKKQPGNACGQNAMKYWHWDCLRARGVDEFKTGLAELLQDVTKDDELIVLGDIIGGSPLSTTLGFLDEAGLLSKAVVIGGMNLPLALSCVLMKDTMDLGQLVPAIIAEATGSLKEFVLASDEDDDI